MFLKRLYFQNWFLKILSLCITLYTINCGCKPNEKAAPVVSNQSINNTDFNNPINELKILIAAPDNVENMDIIEFQIKNEEKEAIDLHQMVVNLKIMEKKDTSGQEVVKGIIVPIFHNKGLHIQSSKAITGKTIAAFTGEEKLVPGEKTSIFVRLVDVENLASGKVTCQLTYKTTELASKTVSFKFTKPILPENIQLDAKINNVIFTDATKKLVFTTQLKNTTDHPISLDNLKFKFVFEGPLSGENNFTSQELLGTNDTHILRSGETITLPNISNEITEDTIIEILKMIVGKKDSLFIVLQITTEEGSQVLNMKQPVVLSSPDLPEIGPKDDSIIDYTIDISKTKLKDEQLFIPVTIHNNSAHSIDLEQILNQVQIYDENSNIIETFDFRGNENVKSGQIMIPGQKFVYNINLDNSISNKILTEDKIYTLHYTAISNKNSRLLSELKEIINIPIGPVVGESTVTLTTSDKLTLRHNQTKGQYEIVFNFTISNTSPHIINLYKTLCHILIEDNKNNNLYDQIGSTTNSDFFLSNKRSSTIQIPIGIPGNTQEEAYQFLQNKGQLTFEINMLTSDQTYNLGQTVTTYTFK